MNGGTPVPPLLTGLSRVAAYVSALFLTAMMMITVADVILRALFNLPITGAYDLVQLFLVGTVFLSIPDVFLRDDNIVIDFVDHVFGVTAVAVLRIAAYALALIFLGLLCWRMVPPALDALKFHEVSPDLSISMGVHWSLMIIGIVITLPVAAWILAMSVKALINARAPR